MAAEFPVPELPARYASKIHEIAVRKGKSDEEVIAELMTLILDLAEHYPKEDDSFIATRLRSTLREEFGIGN